MVGVFKLLSGNSSQVSKQQLRDYLSSVGTVNWGYHENKSLGIGFRCPTDWGEVEEKENISINYLFPTYLPDKLKEAFFKKGLGENFVTEFKQWDREKQVEFLKKDIYYNDFLSRDFVISFSKNDNLTLHAFNRDYVNTSGHETVVPIYPSY